MQKLYIGVDPDIDKSGVCLYYSKTNFELLNLKFFVILFIFKIKKSTVKSNFLYLKLIYGLKIVTIFYGFFLYKIRLN